MKQKLSFPKHQFKTLAKLSALGVTLVFITYGFVWVLLHTLQLFIEGVS
ncbi:MAG: hypothetical protein ACOVP6_10190 [Lacibacter sp.]|jgi:hypothetical protein